MSLVLNDDSFIQWLGAFLPGLTSGEPKSLFTPAQVSDAKDGQLAHLHGLNLYRAFVMNILKAKLSPDDKRQTFLQASIEAHTAASLSAVIGTDYMVEHWLAAYAMLYLSGG
jgi:hypothetical protein